MLNYVRRILKVPHYYIKLKRGIAIQQSFIADTIQPILETQNYKEDGSLSASDFEKIKTPITNNPKIFLFILKYAFIIII